jgi:hypothetical protein
MLAQLPVITGPTRVTARLRAAHPVPAHDHRRWRACLASWGIFAANIRNPHTRRARDRAVAEFLAWRADQGVPSVAAVQPLHVSAWIELQQQQTLRSPA